MATSDNINNSIKSRLIEKSLFTVRQIEIIYRIKHKEKRIKEISAGAYYRESKQSKNKLGRLLYSFILLNLLDVIDKEQIMVLNSITDNLKVLVDNHDRHHEKELINVMNVIEELINKMIIR